MSPRRTADRIRRKLAPPPIPAVADIQDLLVCYVGTALWWWIVPNGRSSGPAFTAMVSLGRHVSSAHQMWLWAFLWTLVSLPLAVAVLRRDPHLAGIGSVFAAGMCGFYAVLAFSSGLLNTHSTITGLMVYGLLARVQRRYAKALIDWPAGVPWA